MIDRKFIGYRTTPFSVEVERGRLKLFAKAIGETDPVYSDDEAARAAGYPALPVPLTFLFCLEMERDDPYDWFAELDLPLSNVLHGEQAFEYHALAYAGETLRFESVVTDIFDKKNGELEFLVQKVSVTNQHDARVATFDRTLVVQHVR